jgi:hypothetical protein
MQRTRFVVLAGFVLAAAASRLLPHPPNLTPVAAMALFGGAHFPDKRAAFFVTLAAMFLSDLVIGLHRGIPVVYGCFALIVCIGLFLRTRKRTLPIAAAALSSSILFFLLTNFAVWARGVIYPKTFAGLAACYVAAIPFFRNTLIGDLAYTAILFGGFALLERRYRAIREPAPLH